MTAPSEEAPSTPGCLLFLSVRFRGDGGPRGGGGLRETAAVDGGMEWWDDQQLDTGMVLT